MKGAKLTMKAASPEDEMAAAIRKKRAEKAVEEEFNRPSAFHGISQGELNMLIEDANNVEKHEEEPMEELSPAQIKKIQEKFLKHDYNFSDTGNEEE